MTASELKKSILQMAVEGKLTEQSEKDEPVEELLKRIKEEKESLIKEGKIKKEKTISEIYKKDGSYYERVSDSKNILKDACIDEELPFEIPDTWTWVRLGNIVYNHGQIKPSSDFCYIDIGSIDNEKQQLSNNETIISYLKAPSRARKIVIIGDILYSTVRPYLHNMCIIDREFSKQPIASTGFAVLTCHSNLYNKFLFYYLLSPYFDKYANHVENSKGIAYPAINDQRLYIAFIPIPPIEEQKRIVEKINLLMPLINEYDELEKSITKLNKEFPDNIKKSILQYAIEGKLTEQSEKDEPAEELLKRIKKEREKLIKEGKIKKDKTTSEIYKKDGSYYERVFEGNNIVKDVCIDDELPFEIPDSWTFVRLGNICKLTEGEKRSNERYVVMDARFLRGKGDGILSNSGKYISAGTYLILVDGENSGEVFIAKENGYMGSTFKILNIPLCLNEYYVLYFLELYKLILKKSKKGVAIPHLNKELFFNLLFPLPPIEEQKRIVDKINRVNEVINTIKV
ncbi:restriction endonuclease subunit S [Brachyspira pulli]|uniref:restriction endonuclease subunit S n=1 Tax=Brachyspira pulli TaxID=310721 RepID=UPI003004BFF1